MMMPMVMRVMLMLVPTTVLPALPRRLAELKQLHHLPAPTATTMTIRVCVRVRLSPFTTTTSTTMITSATSSLFLHRLHFSNTNAALGTPRNVTHLFLVLENAIFPFHRRDEAGVAVAESSCWIHDDGCRRRQR